MPPTKPTIPVVVFLTTEEHAALRDLAGSIANDVTLSSVSRYLIIDYLASEFGVALDVPGIDG